MDKKFNYYVSIYKKEIEKGDIQVAYENLIKYVMSLKIKCEKSFSKEFSFGNTAPGYMDITYFSFVNKFLLNKKLRFGIILNHKKMQFELWLMGRNAEIQKKYWDLLKDTKWNKEQLIMPKYSILEVVLSDEPNFDNLESLDNEIVNNAIDISREIMDYIGCLEK